MLAGKFKARIAGIIIFGDSFQYKTKAEFYADSKRHMVFGWPVLKVKKIRADLPKDFKKGIVFAKNVPIEFQPSKK